MLVAAMACLGMRQGQTRVLTARDPRLQHGGRLRDEASVLPERRRLRRLRQRQLDASVRAIEDVRLPLPGRPLGSGICADDPSRTSQCVCKGDVPIYKPSDAGLYGGG